VNRWILAFLLGLVTCGGWVAEASAADPPFTLAAREPDPLDVYVRFP
jgi:hypothetical protein